MQSKVQGTEQTGAADGEQGFMLLGLIVVIAIIMLWLGVAASEAAFSIRRDRELESARRADQYVRAIRKFYIKNGNHYPGSIEQLENTNNVRFLRQRYIDPLSGQPYRLIAVGQNKTTVKGFFGQPLAGLPTAGLGAAAGMQSSGIPGPTGANGTPGSPSSFGSSGTGTGGAGAGGTGPGATGTAGASDSFNGTQIPTGMPGAMGPFMGVGSSATGNSILVINEQTTYETWEFLYDPRIEKLKAAAALNAGASSTSAGSLGTTPGAFGAPSGFGSSSGSTPSGPGGSSGGSAAGGTTPQP